MNKRGIIFIIAVIILMIFGIAFFYRTTPKSPETPPTFTTDGPQTVIPDDPNYTCSDEMKC